MKCLRELDDAVPEEFLPPSNMGYTVSLRENGGKYVSITKYDPLINYERGRRTIPLNIKDKK